MTSKYDLRGRKAILAFWGLADWQAVMRRLGAGAPIRKEPDGRTWVACSVELDAWSEGANRPSPCARAGALRP